MPGMPLLHIGPVEVKLTMSDGLRRLLVNRKRIHTLFT